MEKRKRVSAITPSKKKPIKSSSQVHVVSSGLKSKKARGGCGSCGKRRIK
ncbi:hypothetical protein [Anaerobacillus arseniciselenatis]|nr:hypothetical protein [Anaerobacillus arseniciselenatis]